MTLDIPSILPDIYLFVSLTLFGFGMYPAPSVATHVRKTILLFPLHFVIISYFVCHWICQLNLRNYKTSSVHL